MQSNYSVQQLYTFLEKQQREIAQLKKSIKILSKELRQLKEKPSVNVERLEYKFDQLKVETLEGTLNIGINPSDLNSIEDFSVPGATPKTQAFVRHPDLYDQTIQKLNKYIDHELESLIKDTGNRLGNSIEEPYISMIKEDIRKQVPARADHYLGFFSTQANDEMKEEELYDKVYQTLLGDINKAVHQFLSQIPNHMGGGDPNAT